MTNARKPLTIEEWATELSYIHSVDAQMAVNGDPGPDFNHDPKCFDRYCRMQARFCYQDGFDSIAYRIHSEEPDPTPIKARKCW